MQSLPFPLHPRGPSAVTRLSLLLGKSFAAPRVLDSMHTVTSELSTSLLAVTPPTKVVPAPELSPIHEIPLDAPTPTLAPRTPNLSHVEVVEFSSDADTEGDFEDLIAILSDLSANGGPTPRFSTVFSLWRDREPDAFGSVGADEFKAHLQLAESAGVIVIEQRQDGDGWVILRHQWNTNSNLPPQDAGSQFHDLIKVLNDLRLAGDPEPQLSTVGPRLSRENSSVYKDAGVRKFEEYVQAAVEAGVITVRGVKNGDGSLKLSPAYCSSPVCYSTPARTVSAPPTLAANVASPFAPLVEFLKSRQPAGGQPISFSEIFAHLVSTLGYGNLVSLCSSVPGVTTFGQYIDEAIDSGLVSLVGGTTASRDALISLHGRLPEGPPPQAQPNVSTIPPPSPPPSKETTAPPPSVNVTPSSFRDLTAVLTELEASTGVSAFRFSSVIPLLLERKPNVYASVGVARFMDYIALAMENGVVNAGGMDQGDGWVLLRGPGGWDASPQPSKSPEDGMVTSPPPSVTSKGGGVDPKFVDLVEMLGELWKKGDRKPLLAHAGSELMKIAGSRARTLTACGVSKFKPYVKLAREAGIVEIYGEAGKESMSLNPTIRVKAGYT